MQDDQFTLGSGFNVAVVHDACGCTIHFRIARFNGLEKSIDVLGNQTVRYLDGGLGRIAAHTAHTDIPGERDDRLSSDTVLEWYDIPEDAFEEWLQRRLLDFHLLGAPGAAAGSAEWAVVLERVGVDTADIMDAIDLADVQADYEVVVAETLGFGSQVSFRLMGGLLVASIPE